MSSRIMLNTKNYIVFAVPYLTIVCCLYHLVYYGIFGLNGLELVSISNIVTSAVYPLLWTIVAQLFGIFVGQKFFARFRTKQERIPQENVSIREHILKFIFLLIFNFILLFLPAILLMKLTQVFLVVAMVFGNAIIGLLDSEKYIRNDIGRFIDKDFLLSTLIYLPLFSIAIAFQNAFEIKLNESYKFTAVNRELNSGVDTLKFIGITEQGFLFIDKDNEKLHFIQSDNLVIEKR